MEMRKDKRNSRGKIMYSDKKKRGGTNESRMKKMRTQAKKKKKKKEINKLIRVDVSERACVCVTHTLRW
jgi:hypothetical protein